MLKTLLVAVLLSISMAMKVEVQSLHLQGWTNATSLSDSQKDWDSFFRDTIKAIGDSETKEVLTNANGAVSLRYLDTTNDGHVTVAWEVVGANDGENKRIEKIVQVKTIPDQENPNLSTVTKTTFIRDNLINVTKELLS